MRVKICGITSETALHAAAAEGAAYVGLVFFPKSPRSLEYAQARALSLLTPEGIAKVALTVDMDNGAMQEMLDQVPIDMIQLHGGETPQRVAEIKDRFGLPVMKAVGIRDEADLAGIAEYSRVADQLLVDAKPPKAGALPGGNGLSFDWRLIAGRRWAVPWMLAGGLTPENVATAVHLTGANQVDVSSGVESAPGVKDEEKIAAFIRAAAGET